MITTELPDLDGFVEHHGIRITALGDDGEVLVALGHHKPRTAVIAFRAALHDRFGSTLADWGDFHTPRDVEEALRLRWAVLLTACGTCDGVRDCWACRDIRDASWWMDYAATEPVPAGFPVTILTA